MRHGSFTVLGVRPIYRALRLGHKVQGSDVSERSAAVNSSSGYLKLASMLLHHQVEA